MSIIWPPIMPSLPAAFASSRTSRQRTSRRWVGRGLGQNLEGEGQKRIARQHRGRLVEGLLGRGPAAAQIVVVHAGQIVMHQRIGVQGLDGGGRARGPFGLTSNSLALCRTRNGRRRLPPAKMA